MFYSVLILFGMILLEISNLYSIGAVVIKTITIVIPSIWSFKLTPYFLCTNDCKKQPPNIIEVTQHKLPVIL